MCGEIDRGRSMKTCRWGEDLVTAAAHEGAPPTDCILNPPQRQQQDAYGHRIIKRGS